jgi:DNA helicase-2/ATP-dependent DNA helicase PcrA
VSLSALQTVNSTPSSSAASLPGYLQKLNPEQLQASQIIDGALLVLAGAGTGKTRVLTTRITHLIASENARAGEILAVTFTNKAAREMRERVEAQLQALPENAPQAHGLWLGTFHSTGAKILRQNAELLGLTSQFTILDDDDQQRLIKQLLIAANIDHTKFTPRVVLGYIQSWKDRGLTPDKAPKSDGDYSAMQVAAQIYPSYQARLKALNCCDFGDLLLHNLTLFAEHSDVLKRYSERFRFILVDEFQDTNVAQYMWLRMLALSHKNLCCVGDDDQSIYGWRGAEVTNILKFEQDYPGTKTIRLERNYRSTTPILKAASALIAHNKNRLGKTLWTESNDGAPIRIKSVWDDAEEARFVGEEIETFQRDKIPLSDMAVLVRAGFQTRSFEERFITLGVPYRVIGGLRFYERREIRDAIAYIRICHQPHDDLALERIINTPRRGIGKATLETIHQTARGNNISMHTAIEQMLLAGNIKGKASKTLASFMQMLREYRALLAENPLAETVNKLLDASGYRPMWQADRAPEAAGRLENLRELIHALGEFPDAAAFLEHVGLVTDMGSNNSDDMVSIMSLHAAKGLEFDVVFLTGWEEGLFPSQRTMDEQGAKGIEEERRLAYVGITRAKRHLLISSAANRRIYNQWQSCVPSRFIAELPEDALEEMAGGPYAQRATGPALFQKGLDDILATSTPESHFDKNAIRKGSLVNHAQFGSGVVLGIKGEQIQIIFKQAGTKTVLADYLELV